MATQIYDKYDNFTLYERLVTKATPMMLVAWLKNETESGVMERCYTPISNRKPVLA